MWQNHPAGFARVNKYWMSHCFGALIETRDYKAWRVLWGLCWGSFENSKGRPSLWSELDSSLKEGRIFEESSVVHGNARPSDNPKLAEPSNEPYRTVWSGYYWVLGLVNCDIRSWTVVRGTARNGVDTVRWRWNDADLFLVHRDNLTTSKLA